MPLKATRTCLFTRTPAVSGGAGGPLFCVQGCVGVQVLGHETRSLLAGGSAVENWPMARAYLA